MATYVQSFVAALIIMISLVVIAAGTPINPENKLDLDMAIDEMERANYFTFVMLMNMVNPPNLFQGINVTFLIPSDKSLSRSMILQNMSVTDLLLRHSIPSSLLFDHLLHLPTNTILPTSNPNFMLKVSNNGRKGLLLGNVRIVSPNICTHGYSVRCHGIDSVLNIVDVQKPSGLPPSPVSTCPQIPMIPTAAAPPPNLGPAASDDPLNYQPSKGGKQQMKLSLTCMVFVWVVYSKSVSLV